MSGGSAAARLLEEERDLARRVAAAERRVERLRGRALDVRVSGLCVEVARPLIPAAWPDDSTRTVERLNQESSGGAEAHHTDSRIEWWADADDRRVRVRLDRGAGVAPVLRLRDWIGGEAGCWFGLSLALAFYLHLVTFVPPGPPVTWISGGLLTAGLLATSATRLVQRRRCARRLRRVAEHIEQTLYAEELDEPA